MAKNYIPKGLVRKQKELLQRKYGRNFYVPIRGELKLVYPDWCGKTAKGKLKYYFATGCDKYNIYAIAEKLLENL